MGQEREPRAGDALVDRYFPDADDETRERAREAFRDFALFIFRMGERIVNERDAEASSPNPTDGAILSEAPREPPV
ncbi:MAG TPA: hypothetical protein VMU93_05530 [Caulobacteraceae bacterium]|nr:hypothetical protein [Caulobacteraceae bacterium]